MDIIGISLSRSLCLPFFSQFAKKNKIILLQVNAPYRFKNTDGQTSSNPPFVGDDFCCYNWRSLDQIRMAMTDFMLYGELTGEDLDSFVVIM